jgi:hypothetical protein
LALLASHVEATENRLGERADVGKRKHSKRLADMRRKCALLEALA